MSKGSFAEVNCPIAQTLEQVGEWWSLVIVRNAFCGMSRFQDFQRHLGISSNVLTQRLGRLVDYGILCRQASPDDGRIVHYQLTDKGRALYPILAAMTVWGEQWAPHPDGARMILVERGSGAPIGGVGIFAADGRQLSPAQIDTVAGPAADDKTHVLMRMRMETMHDES